MALSIEKKNEIERDVAMMDFTRAVRSFSLHKQVAHRWRSLYSTANDDKWREICQASKPVKEMEQREYARAKEASFRAQDYGATQGQLHTAYQTALVTGRSDADSMTTQEVRAFIRDSN